MMSLVVQTDGVRVCPTVFYTNAQLLTLLTFTQPARRRQQITKPCASSEAPASYAGVRRKNNARFFQRKIILPVFNDLA